MKEKLLELIIGKQDEIIIHYEKNYRPIKGTICNGHSSFKTRLKTLQLIKEYKSLASQLAEIEKGNTELPWSTNARDYAERFKRQKATMKDLTDSDEAIEMEAPFDEPGCFNPEEK